MKKVFFIVFAVMFAVSVNAHEQTKSFHQQFGTQLAVNTTSTSSMQAIDGGGLIHFIYNIFHKVGKVFYTQVNEPKEDEITGNQES